MSGYDEMPAGRELDALVAEKVMGRETTHWTDGFGDTGVTFFAPVEPYSTDIAAAWEVVERINMNGYDVHIDRVKPLRSASRLWYVAFLKGPRVHQKPIKGDGHDPGCLPTAICRAALKAVSND